MKETRVANRYAKALLELAIEINVLEKIKEDAELIIECLQTKPGFCFNVKKPGY